MVKSKIKGMFTEIFGDTPRNLIIEFFLEMGELDFSIGDVAEELGMNRATAYNTFAELANKGYLVETRRVSGAQLYKLGASKYEVKLLMKIFDMLLDDAVNKYRQDICIE